MVVIYLVWWAKQLRLNSFSQVRAVRSGAGLAVVLAVGVWFLLAALAPLAQAAPATISQGFRANANLPAGTIVSSDPKNLSDVVLTDLHNTTNLVGVVAASQSAVIDISTPNTTLSVGTAGIFYTSISTLNGDVHQGDYITISPIAGVGMKAVNPGRVLGTAQADFNAQSSGARQQNLNDKTGQTHRIAIGQIPVLVDVQTWVGATNSNANPFVKNLQAIFGSVTGKQISAVRAVAGLAILIIGLGLASLIVFTTVSSSIHSLGRNPLAQHSVTRNLLMVIIMVVVLISATFVSSYYVLSG